MLSGGVESVIMNYYRNINRNNIQFDFLCNTEEVAYEDEIKALGGRIFRITARSKNLKKYKEDMTAFFSNNAKEYDTIWVNVCSLANIDYLKYAKKYGIKRRIMHCHNSQNMDSFFRGILHRYNKVFLKKYATDYWSCSDDASLWFYSKKMIESDKFLVVKNAIDLEKFTFSEQTRNEYRKKLGIEDKYVIGHVGRFHFQKNHTFLIKIFNEIYKIRKDAILLLIGVGPDEEKIKQMVKDYNLEEAVIFLGSRGDVPQLMQAMDMFILPSVFEGLGIVAIEAQATGLPVFASEKVIPSEVNIDSKIFTFYSLEKSPEEWGKQIVEFDKNYNKDSRKDNKELVRNAGYDIRIETKKLENIFEK